MSGDFSPEQKRYLEGFVSGFNAARTTRGAAATPTPGVTSGGSGAGRSRRTRVGGVAESHALPSTRKTSA